MRHAIIVVGSEEQRRQPAPKLAKQDDEAVRMSTWYASLDQDDPSRLLDDPGGIFFRMLLTPVLAYRFYVMVQNTKLWSGKRPLILVQGRSLASRVAAYAGTWGGGDVVKADMTDLPPLGPTRFVLGPGGKLKLRPEAKA